MQAPPGASIMSVFSVHDIKFMKGWPIYHHSERIEVVDSLLANTFFDQRRVSHSQSNIQRSLVITNLKKCWVRKADANQIVKEKELYNKSIQTNSFVGIIDIIEKIICSFDSQSKYIFHEANDSTLQLDFQSLIKIYPLKWTFILTNIFYPEFFEILCEDLVNPLVCTVQTLEQKCQHYRTALSLAEKELTKRMNEKEKLAFQSKANDTEDEWKQFIRDDLIANSKICQMPNQPSTNYFMKCYSLQKFQQMEKQHKKRNFPLADAMLFEQGKAGNKQDFKKKEAIMNAYEQSLMELFQAKDNQNQSQCQPIVQEVKEAPKNPDDNKEKQVKNTKKKVTKFL